MPFVLMKGFFSSASLIISIGAQNAFVIRQGLARRDLLLTAFLCAFIDAVLIVLGVLGFGQIIAEYPFLIVLTKGFAILFLVLYGAYSFKSIFESKRLSEEQQGIYSRRKTLLLLLMLTLLNPHVYLDTVILLGSIAAQYPSHEQFYFAIGAIGASFFWFFSLTYGTRYLAPLLNKPTAWKIIDGLTGLTMWGIALNLWVT